MHYIPILSTLVTLIFAVAVFNRYFQRGGLHLLFWGIGLIFYGLGTLTEVVMLFTFNPWALKLWYLTGAMLTAAWLGQGTVNLLVRKRGVARALNITLVIASTLAFLLVMLAPVDAGLAAAYNTNQPASAQYGEILSRSGLIIFLTIFLNLYGTLTLVGGAIYSAFLFWRKKVLINRLIGNILIAAGALMPALGGSLLKAGMADWLYLSEFLGAVLMYLGFVQATVPQPAINQVVESPATD